MNASGEAVAISIDGSDATDAALEHLAALNTLTRLDLINAYALTDAGIVHLKGLKNLRSLSLPQRLTNDGLINLKGLAKLETVTLPSSQVTDAGLENFNGLPKSIPQVSRDVIVPTCGGGQIVCDEWVKAKRVSHPRVATIRPGLLRSKGSASSSLALFCAVSNCHGCKVIGSFARQCRPTAVQPGAAFRRWGDS